MLHFNRKDRRPHGSSLPTEQKLGRRPANATLACSHSAAGLKLCFACIPECSQFAERDVLAAANDRAGFGEAFQLASQSECAIERRGETLCPLPLRK